MTTGAELPILAFGPSAISSFPKAFMQRPTDFYKWNKAPINEVKKGMSLTDDDLLHRWVIENLYCYRRIDKAEFKARFTREFDEVFLDRRDALKELEDLGLVTLKPNELEVTAPLGVLLLRIVASVFDAYLAKDAYKTGIEATQASKIG